MFHRIIVCLILILTFSLPDPANGAPSKFPPISDQTRISLITLSPGTELWACWGHSAIRVCDPASGLDLAYNYGTFDFNKPGFYIKFLRGNLNYYLSVYEFKYMVLFYKESNQTIFEQELDLNEAETREVYAFLNMNAQPENKYYLYEFFFDNCSTRIRDLFDNIIGDSLIFQENYIGHRESYRQLVNDYLKDSPWEKFGINLIFGMPTDSLASSFNYMFLPVELKAAFTHAERSGKNARRPIVKEDRIIFKKKSVHENTTRLTPVITFWSLFLVIVAITFYEIRQHTYLKWLDFILFLLLGLAGCLIAFLWFGTNHIQTKNNINMFWAFPVHAIIAFYLPGNVPKKWISYYFLFWSIFLTLMIAGWYFIPQHILWTVFPVLFIIIIRTYRIYIQFKPKP